MVPDLTLEVVYYNQPTDFKMEFQLCNACNVRFLSTMAKSRMDFLTALSKSVVRSRAVIAVGSFNPLDREYLPKIVAKAIGYSLKPVSNEDFKISSPSELFLPDTAMPLVNSAGEVAGCAIENNDQVILLLSSERELRHTVLGELVCPYLRLFAERGTGMVTDVADLPEDAPAQGEDDAALPVETETDPADDEIDSPEAESVAESEVQAPISEGEPAPTEDLEDTDESLPPYEGYEDGEDNGDSDNSAEDDIEDAIEDAIEDNADNTEAANEVAEKNGEIPLEILLAENEAFLNSVGRFKNPPEAESTGDESPKFTVLERPEIAPEGANPIQDFLTEDDTDEETKKSRKGWIKVLISVILVAAVLLAAYFGYEWVFQPMQKQSVYESVREMYGQTWEGLPENMLCKFGRLYKTNSDVYGWIKIPQTTINLPVVSSAEKSAGYYDSHLFDGSVNRYGTLHTDAPPGGEYVRNTVIQGKDMGEGQMLSDIKKYLDIDHYKNVPTFTFDTLYEESVCKIFAVFTLKDSQADSYTRTSFFDDSDFMDYCEAIKKVSIIDTDIDLAADDRLVTLHLKTDGRDVIVVARLVRDGESVLVDVTGADLNDDSAMAEDIPAIAAPSGIIDISSNSVSISDDEDLKDGASQRFEQSEPMVSDIIVVPNISSAPQSEHASSKKPTTSTVKPSSTATTTSAPAVSDGKLPTLTITNNLKGGIKESGPALDIIAGILEAEMGSHYGIEALKAQAIAAYSWLLCNGSADGGYPVAPRKEPGARARQAAEAVKGQVMVYGGKVVATYYYALSAGKTANNSDIWAGGQLPYLVSVDSSVDKNISGFQTVRMYSAADVANWAMESLDVDLTKIADKNKWFTCTYDKNGVYVSKVKIGTVTKTGPYLRNSFFTSARVGSSNLLRSSAYTIEYNSANDKFIFTVRGYGHGVGMSQRGARVYAEQYGWSCEKILKHYFTGISFGTYFI